MSSRLHVQNGTFVSLDVICILMHLTKKGLKLLIWPFIIASIYFLVSAQNGSKLNSAGISVFELCLYI